MSDTIEAAILDALETIERPEPREWWVEAVRPMRHVVPQMLERLRESIEPPMRRTEPQLAIERTLDV
jgi:hypothetical protein